MKSVKIAAFGLVVMGALFNTGCTSLDNLHSAAVVERQANPEKYTEIPAVRQMQQTPNQDGMGYQDSCAFGCPADQSEKPALASGN